MLRVYATAAFGHTGPAARPLPAWYHPGLSVQSRMILSRYSPSVMPSARAATLAERTVRLARLAMSSRPGSGRPSGSRSARPSASSLSRALTTATAVRLEPRQQPRCTGLPDDDVEGTAFTADPGPPVGQVEIL